MHISEMFRLIRGTGHILDVLDVLHRDQVALRIHDGAFSAMDLTARHPRTGELSLIRSDPCPCHGCDHRARLASIKEQVRAHQLSAGEQSKRFGHFAEEPDEGQLAGSFLPDQTARRCVMAAKSARHRLGDQRRIWERGRRRLFLRAFPLYRGYLGRAGRNGTDGSITISGTVVGADAVVERAQKIASYGLSFELLHVLVSRENVALSLHNTAQRPDAVLDEYLTTVCRLRDGRIAGIETYLSDVPGMNAFFV
ncbi:hypothetical protein [Streptomyces roseoverticillatus]|uniref:hypothetical protein n=1 Tax=Streptomyces roseoverticillatus TaxID=66429 RepID=UPI003F540FB5